MTVFGRPRAGLGASLAALLFVCLTIANPARSEDLMLVLDGSGSMWGQVEGRTKIEIARETLSGVLSEVSQEQAIGMMAYGHRTRGDCSDIETVVPIGPAATSIPTILAAAGAVSPRGKTPLTDAVRRAAAELRFTEEAATVVLLTDGVETCDADPCALGAELEAAGIDFTAHVVGFDIAPGDEVALRCLAKETGGLYLPASDAGQLRTALDRAVRSASVPPSEITEPVISAVQEVRLTLRDVEGGPVLTARQVSQHPEPGDALTDVEFIYDGSYTARGTFTPGPHTVGLLRQGPKPLRLRLSFDVPEGPGPHAIDRVLAARLAVDVMLNDGLPYDYDDPPAAAVKDYAYVYIDVFPMVTGTPDEENAVVRTPGEVDIAIDPGRYLLRGTLDRTVTVEREVDVPAGEAVRAVLDFDATPVFVDARAADGAPVEYQTTFLHDGVPAWRTHWRKGWGDEEHPFWLPTGVWGVDVGQEGGEAGRSRIVVSVPGDHVPIRRRVAAGTDDETAPLMDPARVGCAALIGAGHTGCLMAPGGATPAVALPSSPSDFAPTAIGASDGPALPSANADFVSAGNLGGDARPMVMPVGVFAVLPAPPDSDLPLMRSTEADDMCRNFVTVMYPDGVILLRELLPDMTFFDQGHGICRSGDNSPTVCEIAGGGLDSPRGRPETRRLTFDAAGGDDVLMCDETGGACELAYACVGPGRPLGPDDANFAIGTERGLTFLYGADGTLQMK